MALATRSRVWARSVERGIKRVQRNRALSSASFASDALTANVPAKHEVVKPDKPDNNVTEHIYSKLGQSLHTIDDQPIGILKACRIFVIPHMSGSLGGCEMTHWRSTYVCVCVYGKGAECNL